jgi:predicted transcriptional regulator
VDAVETLKQLGFSEYEARAYVALLKRGPLNGYELSKTAGLPRANIYSVLEKLVARGAALRLDAARGTQYVPVAVDEIMRRLGKTHRSLLAATKKALQAHERAVEDNRVWNADGYSAGIEHAQTLIRTAKRSLLLACHPAEAAALAVELQRAENRKVKITTLCMAACAGDCAGCQGTIYRTSLGAQHPSRWFILVADDKHMLAAEINESGRTRTVVTDQAVIVQLAAAYIRNNIALGVLVDGSRGRLEPLLNSQTKAALNSLGFGRGDQSFFKSIHQFLR